MTKTPRWHERIPVFNNFFYKFNELYAEYNPDTVTDLAEIKPLFDYLKTCFEFYHKSLRDILTDFCIIEFLPTEILKIAQSKHLIDDSDIWLDFIKCLNIYYQTYPRNEKLNFAKLIIKDYHDKLQNSYNLLNKYYKEHPFNVYYKACSLSYDNKPLYISSEIGILEKSYNLLLNYFKNNQHIKYVWLHGSRAKGNARGNSDIDLLIDVDVNFIEDCKKDFFNLQVPYRIDFACINDIQYATFNDSSMSDFLSKVVEEAKIIYRYTDFI